MKRSILFVTNQFLSDTDFITLHHLLKNMIRGLFKEADLVFTFAPTTIAKISLLKICNIRQL